ncbi:MAG: hypothetical protein AB8C84_05145 [Oligoflexales bacterium]
MKSSVISLMFLSLTVSCGSLDTNQNQITNTQTSIALTVPSLNIDYDTTVMTIHIREGENLDSNREIYRETQTKVRDASTYQILAEPGRSYIAHITYQIDGEDVASTRFCGALTNIIANVATGINHYNPRVCYPSDAVSADVIRSSPSNHNHSDEQEYKYNEDYEEVNENDVIRSRYEETETYLYEDISTGEEFVIFPGDSEEQNN